MLNDKILVAMPESGFSFKEKNVCRIMIFGKQNNTNSTKSRTYLKLDNRMLLPRILKKKWIKIVHTVPEILH